MRITYICALQLPAPQMNVAFHHPTGQRPTPLASPEHLHTRPTKMMQSSYRLCETPVTYSAMEAAASFDVHDKRHALGIYIPDTSGPAPAEGDAGQTQEGQSQGDVTPSS